MSRLSSDRWRALSGHLDEALELDGEERARWLVSLRAVNPALAAELEMLLDEHEALREERFLEHGLPAVLGRGSLAGQTIGAYRLLSLIGEGGMGSVWLAERSDGRFTGRAAIKLLNVASVGHAGEERFNREGSVLARLKHPHIAQLVDAGVAPSGQPYLVLEHVEGQHIDRYCDDNGLGIESRVRLFLDVLAAVAHAHANLIVHRDIKPSNVLVTTSGQVKLLDFGIAKLLETGAGKEAAALTRPGASALTPEYAAPEQLTGQDVTTATDVYALGVLLYVLLTGRHPAGADRSSAAELVRAIVETEPTRPSDAVSGDAPTGRTVDPIAAARAIDSNKLRRTLRGDLDNILAKALKKHASERYASAEAMADDLSRYLGHDPVRARADSLGYRTRKFVRRHRLGVVSTTLAILALTGFAVAMATQAARIAREAEAKQRVSDFLTELFKVSEPSLARGNSVTARELLDKGAARIRGTLADDPRVRADLMTTIGTVYSNLGLYPEAEPLLAEALEERRRLLGRNHPETLRLANEAAQLYFREGRFKEAEALHRETLGTRRGVLGTEHPDTLQSARNLALTYSRQGRNEEAEALQRETLDIEKRMLGLEHPDTLSSMSNLAWTYQLQGNSSKAEALKRETLDIQKRVLGVDHPNTLVTMTSLGWTFQAQGRYREAETLFREALDIQKRVLGTDHPNTLASMTHIAAVYLEQARHQDAVPLLRETLDIEKRVLGAEHADTLTAMLYLSNAYSGLGRYKEAEVLRREVVDTQKRVLGPEHPSTLWSMNNLATGWGAQGRFKEAEALHRETLDIRKRVLGPEHPDTLNSMYNFGLTLMHLGRYEEADALGRETLDIRKRVLGPEHPKTLLSIYNLACIAAGRGARSEALGRLREAVASGFSRVDLLVGDSDLSTLRDDPEFAGIVAAAKSNQERATAAK